MRKQAKFIAADLLHLPNGALMLLLPITLNSNFYKIIILSQTVVFTGAFLVTLTTISAVLVFDTSDDKRLSLVSPADSSVWIVLTICLHHKDSLQATFYSAADNQLDSHPNIPYPSDKTYNTLPLDY